MNIIDTITAAGYTVVEFEGRPAIVCAAMSARKAAAAIEVVEAAGATTEYVAPNYLVIVLPEAAEVTVAEAAAELNVTTNFLVEFDNTLTLDSTLTADEVAQIAEILAGTDADGIYQGV